MSYHILPLLESHLAIAENSLATTIQSWLESWICKEYQRDGYEVQLSSLTTADLEAFSNKSNLLSYRIDTDIREHRLLLGYDEDINALMVELLTGCDNRELNQLSVDMSQLVGEIFSDLINRITQSKTNSQVDADKFITKLNVDLNASAFTVSRVAKITLDDKFFWLLLPNSLLKQLIFGLQKVEGSELSSRESAIEDSQVMLSAKIDGFSISLQDFSTLQVGDVLTTRQNSTEQISLYAENNPITGTNVLLGKKQSLKAVKLI